MAQPTWDFQPRTETGDSPSSIGAWWLAGKSGRPTTRGRGSDGRGASPGDGAHRGGLSMTVSSSRRRTPTGARTRGRRRWRSGWGVVVQVCGAHNLIGLTEEWRKVVSDGGADRGRRWRGKLCCPASLAGAPGRNSMQKVHDVEGHLGTCDF
jgi:hypothetical protein